MTNFPPQTNSTVKRNVQKLDEKAIFEAFSSSESESENENGQQESTKSLGKKRMKLMMKSATLSQNENQKLMSSQNGHEKSSQKGNGNQTARVREAPTITTSQPTTIHVDHTYNAAADNLLAGSDSKDAETENNSQSNQPSTLVVEPKTLVVKHQVRHQVALPIGLEHQYVPIANHIPSKDPARVYPFTLDPFQTTAIHSIERGESVLVSAHTSAGKTVVAEYAIALSIKGGQRVIYTSPIKVCGKNRYKSNLPFL